MKKLLLLLAAIGMVAMGCQTDNDGLDNGGNDGGVTPPSTTETAKIASVEEQGAHITATLATLEDVKSALNTTIETLEQNAPATRGNDNGVKEQIANLQGQINALEDVIIRLTAYTGGELVEMEDWAEATFATLEQQDALATELAALKATVAGLDTVSSAELADALAASEASMNKWVNEQLSGYATVADMDAQIATLQASLTEDSEALREDITALTASLAESKKKITASYKKAIKTAINDFAGVVNEQISNEIAAVNARLDEELATINSRLDAIEARLDKIEEAIKDLVNRIQSVVYVKKHGDNPTPIVTSAEATTVTLDFEISPKSAVEGLSLKWSEYAKVKALYTETTTFVDMPITSFTVDAENGIVTVVASGENLSDEFYTSLVGASLRLEISDGNSDKRSDYVNIVPQRWFSEGISLTPASNELYYITTDGNTLEPTNANNKSQTELFGANITTNLYDWQKGCFVFKFDGDVTKIGSYAFGVKLDNEGSYQSTLKYIAMPNSVTDIAAQAFAYCCDELVSIIIPDSVTAIGRTAFAELAKLESVKLGQNVKSLGLYSFSRCTNLKSINIPNKITTIPDYCFRGCEKLKDIVLHDNIQSIGARAFENCKVMKISVLPANLTTMGKWAFGICNAITSITLPDNLTSVDDNPFFECKKLEYFYGKFASEDNRCFIFEGELKALAPQTEGEYTLPDGITRLGGKSISHMSKQITITIPNTVTEIDEETFARIDNVLGFKGKYASEDGKFLIKDDSLYAYAANGDTKCDVPYGVENIMYRVFSEIPTLQELNLPSTLRSVMVKFVDDCENLHTVRFASPTPPTITDYANETNKVLFYNMEVPNIFVPLNSMANYKAAEYWKDYADKINGYIL